jgi:predicted Zn-dependent peptidase
MKTGFENLNSNIPNFGSLNIYFDAGGKIEQEGYRGISHLAEHLICKAYDNVLEKLDAHGIEYNASTGENSVTFYFNGLNEHLKKFESEFVKIFDYIPSQEDFEKEKKIVLSEYTDTFSSPQALFLNIHRKYLNSFTAIGFRKDIEEITYEQYVNFQKTFFKNPSYILRVCATDYYDYYSQKTYSNIFEKEYIQKDYGDEFLENDRSTRKSFVVNWKVSDMNEYVLEFLMSYFGNGLTSPLMKEFREKLGMVYHVQFASSKVGKNSLVAICYECEPKDRKTLQKELKNIFKNVDEYITKDRYENVIMTMKTTIDKSEIFNHEVSYSRMRREDYTGDKLNYYTFFEGYSLETFKKDAKSFCKDFLKTYKIAESGRKMKL